MCHKGNIAMSSEEDDEIEMRMEASDDATEVSIVFKAKKEITMNHLIIAIEEYLSELTRAESDKRRHGVEIH